MKLDSINICDFNNLARERRNNQCDVQEITATLRAVLGRGHRLLPRPVPSNLRQELEERSTYLQAKGTAKLDGPRTYVWGLSRRRDVELNLNCEKSVLSRGVQFLGGYCRADDQSKAAEE